MLTLTLGDKQYTQSQMLALLNLPVTGDASLVLADQLIAAKLNVAAGAPSTKVSPLIAVADQLLASLPGRLPYAVPPWTFIGGRMIAVASALDAYNNSESTCGGVRTPTPVPSATPTRTSTPPPGATSTNTPVVDRTATATRTVSPTPPAGPCPLTPGYWKTHPEAWPALTLVLGDEPYAQAELLLLLETPVMSDASLILAYQLVAAKLNVAAGAPSAAVSPVIAVADELLAPFAGKLPYSVPPWTFEGAGMVLMARALAAYNNSERCTPPATPTATRTPSPGTATATATVTAPQSACPSSPGYWMTQPDAWPVTSLQLGGRGYSQAQLIALLGLPVVSDASLILAKQLIAAKLNLLNGTAASLYGAAVDLGDAQLAPYARDLPLAVSAISAQGQGMLWVAADLKRETDACASLTLLASSYQLIFPQ